MKKYEVTITETLQMTVPIEAGNRAQAEEIAEEGWNGGKYVLGADHFVGADFKAQECRRSKDMER